nr:tetratricopeptide repeat protein [Ardenticatenales bacterium]
AITCWFAQDPGHRALTCALTMQQAMRALASVHTPSGRTIPLGMKVGAASGAVHRFLVGDPALQVIDVLAGELLSRVAAAEQQAMRGEVLLAAPARAILDDLRIETWRTDPTTDLPLAVVGGLVVPAVPTPWPSLGSDSLDEATLRSWLLPVVHGRLSAGQGEFLTELRPAVALFLRFLGIDYERDEAAEQKLDQYIRWVQETLARYEGTLIQLTIGEKGSYLYAAFGAPIAHEDDARRAVTAAMELRALPPELLFIESVQIGISRGTMRTGAYGGTTRRTYGVLGDEVNLAARLMQHAAPGQVLGSGRIQAATALRFQWERLAPLAVKGKQEPVARFALVERHDQQTLHLSEPTYALPMVGRVAERRLIEEKLEQVRHGRGQIVGITGEAGIGKSRLVAEVIGLAQRLGFVAYGGACQSYGTNTPYLLWQPIWRAFFGLDPEAPPAQQAEALAETLQALDPALSPRLPLLQAALNLPLPDNDLTRALDTRSRKELREAFLVDCLRARARAGQVEGRFLLLVLEDCHWLDPLSHDLLEEIGRSIADLPVLMLVAYRPPYLPRLQAPRLAAMEHYIEIPLKDFTPQEASSLIERKLERFAMGKPMAPDALAALTTRAQGNPFYLDELMNYLLDQGIDLHDSENLAALELPDSLHGLILSRMDQLSEQQQITIKVASIIGRRFQASWLWGYYPELGKATNSQQDLDILSQLELTVMDTPEPELAYFFKHIITQEVAYASLAYAMRAALHEQLAHYLEEEMEAAGVIDLDLLAYHYGRSHNLAKKQDYLRRAGDAAQDAFANEAAMEYYEQLLPLLEPGPERVDVRLRLGTVQELVGQWKEAEAQYRAAMAEAETLGSQESQAKGQLVLGQLLHRRGDFQEALSWLEEAQALFTACQVWHEVGHTLAEIGTAFWRRGEYEDAQRYLTESLAMSRHLEDQRGIAQTLHVMGNIAYGRGHYEEAHSLYEESLALRRTLGDKKQIAALLSNLALVTYARGDLDGSRALHEESLALVQVLGNKWGISASLNNLGNLAYIDGDYARARQLYEECLDIKRFLGDQEGAARALGNLGNVALELGEFDMARAQDLESLRIRDKLRTLRGLAESMLGLAALLQRTGQPEPAVRFLGKVDELLETIGGVLSPMLQPLYDETLAHTRDLLGQEPWEIARRAGRALTIDEALIYMESRADE